jgi:hypothetical protein
MPVVTGMIVKTDPLKITWPISSSSAAIAIISIIQINALIESKIMPVQSHMIRLPKLGLFIL